MIAELSADSEVGGGAGQGSVCPTEGVAVQAEGGADAVSVDEEWDGVGAVNIYLDVMELMDRNEVAKNCLDSGLV